MAGDCAVAASHELRSACAKLLKLKTSWFLTGMTLRKPALVLEARYRYITAPEAVPENRLQSIATSHFL